MGIKPSRFLVEQVAQYYQEKTNMPVSKVYGIDPPATRTVRWKTGGILIVATPQVALNDISLLDFNAAIIDECHHTTGDYAYKKLLSAYEFPRREGLSATIPDRLCDSIEESIGPVYTWSWRDPDIEPYVPEWYGEVYDAELNAEERKLIKILEDIRNKLRKSPAAGIPSLAIRMFSRDGALALTETLEKPTAMSFILREAVPILRQCRQLHKIEHLKSVLAEHNFAKAIVFVDRVCVAHAIAEEFEDLNPVCLLGRLHGGSDAQKLALERAKKEETRLVVSTSAGEEGIDLPDADLIVSWSNTASPIRFIQRKGRGMRVSPAGKDKPKADVFIGTPDTPDYDVLYFGIAAASKAGVEILLSGKQKELLKATTLGRLQACLESRAMTLASLAKATALPSDIVKKYTGHLIGEGHAIYIYNFDPKEMLERRIGATASFRSAMTEVELDSSLEQWLDGVYRWKRFAILLNFQMSDSDRFYIGTDILSTLGGNEYARLFSCDDDTMVEATYGFASDNRAQYSAFGNWRELLSRLSPALEQDMAYLTFSYTGKASVTASYHGRFSEESLMLVVRNACWVARQGEQTGGQIWERFKL